MKYLKAILLTILTGYLQLSHAQNANLVIPMGHAQQVNYIDVSHDFSYMASVDDSNIIHLWDAVTKRELFQLNEHPEGLMNLNFKILLSTIPFIVTAILTIKHFRTISKPADITSPEA